MLKNFQPTLVTGELPSVDPEYLIARLPGIEAFWYDLDRTLIGHHEEHFSMEALMFLRAISKYGLKQGFLSNAGPQRAGRAERLTQEASGYIGERLLLVTSTLVGRRKPCRPVYEKAVELSCISAKKSAGFGDQQLKDVWGANRNFAASVLTAPYGTGDNAAVKYLQRPAEAVLRPLVGLPFHPHDFGQVVEPALKVPVAPAQSSI